jgi:HAD-superfamily hydrolase, subfamily IIB
MNKKYFFFDVDGTLTTEKSGGEVTKETLDTIHKLKQNGHFVAIATGRSYAMAKHYAQMTGITNMVTNGGFGLCLDGQLVDIVPLDKESSLKICQEADEKKLGFAVIDGDLLTYKCNNDIFYTKGNKPFDGVMEADIDSAFDYKKIDEFHKVYVSISKEEEQNFKSLKLLPSLRYTDSVLIFEGDDKLFGIKRMLKHLKGSFEDVVVFGDGTNDLSMFKGAPFSIAMGNAVEELKELASFVTKRNDENGITYACKHFGWID